MKLIFSISFIVITIIAFFVVIDPLYKDITELKANVSTYNIALNNSTELQKTRDSLMNTYKNVKQDDKDRLNHMLPSTINNIGLILEIEKISNLHGMPIENIKFDTKNLQSAQSVNSGNNIVVAESNPEDSLPYGVFPMEFDVDGTYPTFLAFLDDLEHNLRLVDIRGISFKVPVPQSTTSQGINSTDPNVYSYTLKVDTYWLK